MLSEAFTLQRWDGTAWESVVAILRAGGENRSPSAIALGDDVEIEDVALESATLVLPEVLAPGLYEICPVDAAIDGCARFVVGT
jgi:hypothetical protein